MRIDFITIGQKMPPWVEQGYQDYAKRLPATLTLNLIEIGLKKRAKNVPIARLQAEEGEKMCAAIATHAHVVALDERGQQWNSVQLATQLQSWQADYTQVALLVGGPEGLAPQCRQRAAQTWSLSALTLPHHLVKIVVAEQLYRAWSINQNHPYHRA